MVLQAEVATARLAAATVRPVAAATVRLVAVGLVVHPKAVDSVAHPELLPQVVPSARLRLPLLAVPSLNPRRHQLASVLLLPAACHQSCRRRSTSGR